MTLSYNPEFFKRIETIYKKRVIIEEIFDIVRSANILSTEISFPLDFIMFSKIKKRSYFIRMRSTVTTKFITARMEARTLILRLMVIKEL